jgi:hypothetical protein
MLRAMQPFGGWELIVGNRLERSEPEKAFCNQPVTIPETFPIIAAVSQSLVAVTGPVERDFDNAHFALPHGSAL